MNGRRVVVTGGFGALGSEVARAFAAAGAGVARLDAQAAPDGAGSVGLDIGGVDLTDPLACAEALRRVEVELGGVDTLVNVAGGFEWRALSDDGGAAWRRMFETNVLTAVNMCQSALPHLLASERASIVNIGALAATRAAAGMGAYAAAKSGVARLTESLAEELSVHDVTVNAVLPSIIDTPANRAAMPDADFADWVPPAAIARVVLFLASEAARSVSGALLPVTRRS